MSFKVLYIILFMYQVMHHVAADDCGDVVISDDLKVDGDVDVNGVLPTTGTVSFEGQVRAKGKVSLVGKFGYPSPIFTPKFFPAFTPIIFSPTYFPNVFLTSISMEALPNPPKLPPLTLTIPKLSGSTLANSIETSDGNSAAMSIANSVANSIAKSVAIPADSTANPFSDSVNLVDYESEDEGISEVTVTGDDITVAGDVDVDGKVPVAGNVAFNGMVPASGSVTITARF